MLNRKLASTAFASLFALAAIGIARFEVLPEAKIGKQRDNRTLVSSGQMIEPETYAFRGRPADMAPHPTRDFFAMSIMSQVDGFIQSQVVLANDHGVIESSRAIMNHHPSLHGLAWSPDGTRLVCSTGERYSDTVNGQPTSDGVLEVFKLEGEKLVPEREVKLKVDKEPGNPVPAGLCFNHDGSKLYVACMDLNAVLELDGNTFKRERLIRTSMLPFAVKLAQGDSTLVVSNWGGKVPSATDAISQTGISHIIVNPAGAAATGTVSVINLGTSKSTEIAVGIHPTDMVVDGSKVYVANSMGNSISTLDLDSQSVVRTDRMTFGKSKLMGSMPTAIQQKDKTLYICNGGDNALAELDLETHQIKGYRPTGYFPVGVQIKGKEAIVINSKGNGSIAKTRYGGPGNVHEFEGTVSILDLDRDINQTSTQVAANNRWGKPEDWTGLPVYKGAIKHVLYIIKENKTYDQIFGDLEKGNGDPKLPSARSLSAIIALGVG